MAVDGQRILTPEQFVKQIKGALDQQKNNITVTFKVEDDSPKKKYDPSDAIYEVTFVHDEMMGITLSNLAGFPLPVREEDAATATATTTTDSLAPPPTGRQGCGPEPLLARLGGHPPQHRRPQALRRRLPV